MSLKKWASDSSGKCCTSETFPYKPFSPFIDHVISEMERRFPNDLKNLMTGYHLNPENLRNSTPDVTESLSVAFDADLPCKGDFLVEIERWRLKVGDHPVHQNIGLGYNLH